ncbi:MAG: hypothetical protein FD123_358 [Bacteroidetes bacterium]|nr:MAG: hypothetical protein FD123_358 [Bacteroidota bacterium]
MRFDLRASSPFSNRGIFKLQYSGYQYKTIKATTLDVVTFIYIFVLLTKQTKT